MAPRHWCALRAALLVLALGTASVSVAESPRVRIGTSGDYPPFSQIDVEEGEDLAPRGFDAALARAWAEERGMEIEWEEYPALAAYVWSLNNGTFLPQR